MNATAQIKTATRQLVDSLLEMNTNNRAVRKSVVDCYKQDIADGRWYLTNQGIGVDINGVLIDGQHRLLAIKESGYPPIPLLIVSGLSVEAQTAIDQHSKRSVRDVWKLVLDHNVSSQAPAICAVLYKSRFGWGGGKISPHRLQDVLNEYLDGIQFVMESVKQIKTWAAPYLAAFAEVAKEQPHQLSEIADFISRVSSGENLTKRMPEYHLRNLLITTRTTGGGSDIQQQRFYKTKRALLASINKEDMGVLRAVVAA